MEPRNCTDSTSANLRDIGLGRVVCVVLIADVCILMTTMYLFCKLRGKSQRIRMEIQRRKAG